MTISPFHAMVTSHALSKYIWTSDENDTDIQIINGDEKLIPIFASANIEVYPHQVAAAMFALHPKRQKGCVLCDETGLGKMIEGMLVIAQKWYEDRQKILIVVPTHLIHQWHEEIQSKFDLPIVTLDNNIDFTSCLENGLTNPFEQESIVLTTYQFAYEKNDWIEKVAWDVALFDEAHRLRRIYTGENKRAMALQKAVKGSLKLLLTATPIQTSMLDLYGLVNFIDEEIFTDEMMFKYRYLDNQAELNNLAERVQKLFFRTMRSQVKDYIRIPKRIPLTTEFELSANEDKLYSKLMNYLEKPNKKAFPKMAEYDLTLMFLKLFSSSTFALSKTLDGVEKRLLIIDNAEKELAEIQSIQKLCISIKTNAKGKALQKTLVDGFAELKKLGANRKALIFTENKTTQKYLYGLLSVKYKGKVSIYNGDVSRDYGIIEDFKNEKQILITTDIAAEGLNMEFCSLVINYDLPYNVQKIEQRVGRCHRDGQKSDVIIISFLNKNNFSDVRILQLINKRLLLFDSVFGASDNVIGNFSNSLESGIEKIIASARTKDEVDKAFNELQKKYDDEIKSITSETKISLFSSFDKNISDKITITPQIVEDKTEELNDMLWDLTKYFFANKSQIVLTEETRSVYFPFHAPKVFTGYRPEAREFSMLKKGIERSNCHTLTGTLSKRIIKEILWKGISNAGTIFLEGNDDISGEIDYYEILVKDPNKFGYYWKFNYFIGMTNDKNVISDEDCQELFAMPIIKWTESSERDENAKLLSLLEEKKQESILTVIEENDKEIADEISELQAKTDDQLLHLDLSVSNLKKELKSLNQRKSNINTILEKVELQKQLNAANNALKKQEQSLFINSLKIKDEFEKQIEILQNSSNFVADIKAIFVVGFYVQKAEDDNRSVCE